MGMKPVMVKRSNFLIFQPVITYELTLPIPRKDSVKYINSVRRGLWREKGGEKVDYIKKIVNIKKKRENCRFLKKMDVFF